MKYFKKIYLSIIFSLWCFLGLSQSQKDSIEQVLDSIYPKQIVSEISTDNYTEYAPSISANGRTLIYESNKDGSWKLYLTRELHLMVDKARRIFIILKELEIVGLNRKIWGLM